VKTEAEARARRDGATTAGSFWKLQKAKNPPPPLETPARPMHLWASALQNCKIINLLFVYCSREKQSETSLSPKLLPLPGGWSGEDRARRLQDLSVEKNE
jgi:hypothetical protein